MGFAEVNGLRIHYELEGQGPPLVLLHGIGSNVRCWRRQLAALSDEFTVIAWDTPGFGQSADPAGLVSNEEYIQYLVGMLDQIPVKTAHILGLSWGGILAMELYRLHPQRVLSLILADTYTGGGTLPPAERDEGLRTRLRPLETMTVVEMAHNRAPALLTKYASAELMQEVISIMSELRPDSYRSATTAMSYADERAVLPLIKVPTLVMCGDLDNVAPMVRSEELRDGIAGARLVVIPKAGHLSNQEQPQIFNAAAREFLRAVVAGDKAVSA